MDKNSWWKEAVFYEIYARSFQDGNGDGIGDIQGIISRLDYLQWLGIKAIWLTPVYPSPMKDFGYDISEYRDIDPMFGSMADFDELLRQIHKKDMKLIMDLVPNHTSDQHRWFLESKSSKYNPKRSWYIWKNAVRGNLPPNNWLSQFGGASWEWDQETEQFYYHSFLKEQPDLNLRNPEVINELKNIMRFWLDKGVDGFRIDSIWYLIKDKYFRNNPLNPYYKTNMPESRKVIPIFSCDQPEVHDLIRNMHSVLEEYQERVMIGEIYLPENRIIAYYGTKHHGVDLPANFHLMFTDWNALDIAILVGKYEASLPNNCWPHWVIGNHDQPRMVSKIGDKQIYNVALIQLTLRGTPTIYYGDEIGMNQTDIPESELMDPQGLNMPDKGLSRDPQRTPMQWSDKPYAGFSTVRPWLPINNKYESINVDTERDESNSLLNFYRRLIRLREQEPSLKSGNYFPIAAENSLFSFIRKKEGFDGLLIIANLSNSEAVFRCPDPEISGTLILSTLLLQEGSKVQKNISLKPNEGIIIRLENDTWFAVNEIQ